MHSRRLTDAEVTAQLEGFLAKSSWREFYSSTQDMKNPTLYRRARLVSMLAWRDERRRDKGGDQTARDALSVCFPPRVVDEVMAAAAAAKPLPTMNFLDSDLYDVLLQVTT